MEYRKMEVVEEKRWSTRLLGALHRELLQIGLPIMLGQVGVILVSFIDNMMVGRYATDHFAAASFVNNLFALVYVIGIGFAYGLTPLVTEAWMRKRGHRSGVLLRHSLVLNLALAAILLILMGVLYFHLEALNPPEGILSIARPYYLLQMVCFVFFMAFNAFKQYHDGVGHTHVGMWAILGGNAVNIGLNALLIYGWWGFPEWGLFGAGVATLVARVLMLIVMGTYFCRLPLFVEARAGFVQRLWSRSLVRRLVKLGVPVGVYSGVETASFTIALIFVTQLGKLPLAVHQILCVVTTIGFFIYYGLGAATTILVSRYRTEGDLVGVRMATTTGLRLCLLSSGMAMSVMLLSRSYIGYIFTSDPEIVAMTSVALVPVILYQVGDAMQVLYANALRGMEDVGRLALYASLCHLVLEPSLAYIFGFRLGIGDVGLRLMLIWCAFPMGLLLLGLLLRRHFGYIVTRPLSGTSQSGKH